MALVDDIRAAVSLGAFATLRAGGLCEAITYRAISAGAYNPTTGATAVTTVETSIPDAILVKYQSRELQGATGSGSGSADIRPTDLKLLINASAYTLTPALTDKVVRASGAVWNVLDVKLEPSGSLIVLQIRQP